MRFSRHFFMSLFILAAAFSSAEEKPAAANAFQGTVQPFLKKHCFECHDEKKAKGDLRLDTLAPEFTERKSLDAWAEIRKRLRDGEMPPVKHPSPPAGGVKSVIAWIEDQTRATTIARVPVSRRLNRIEYENSLRDLFDIPGIDVKDMLPSDGESQGFDTVADALDISYVQMARYLDTADAALDLAMNLGLQPVPPHPQKVIFWPQDSGDWVNRLSGGEVVPLALKGPDGIWNKETGKVQVKNEELQKMYRIKACGTFFHSDPAGDLRFYCNQRLPSEGMYHLRFSAYAFDWDKGELRSAKEARPYGITIGSRLIGYFDAPPNSPGVSITSTWLNQSDIFQFNAVSLDHGHGLNKGATSITGPGVAMEWIEAEGPINSVWPPICRTRLFGDLPLQEWQPQSKLPRPSRKQNTAQIFTPASAAPMEDAEKLLKTFIAKACRRPASAEEVQRYLKLFKAKHDQNVTFEEAMRHAYKGVLCSPEFLFLRAEPAKPGKPDLYALAARLSYFLWSSTPDDKLLELAANGSLSQPNVLRAQTDRLLKDPKSRRFIENFTGQWLKLRDINSTQPDRQLYPESAWESDIAAYMSDSMIAETRAFFATMLNENLSVTNLIDSDFLTINEPLAKLYGIPGVWGSAIRKVSATPESHRGGLLTQGSILKITANGTTSSPVVRGSWFMTRLIGRPIPPPPANVPAIEPDVRGTTTIRAQLEKHRAAESCAGCHAKMDPPGFALESFDVIGNWRENYRMLDKNRLNMKGPPVDPSGDLAGHESGGKTAHFKNIVDFRKLVLADKAQLARNMATKLLIYATGSGLNAADKLEVDDIVARLAAKNYGLRDLLDEVVLSKGFLQ